VENGSGSKEIKPNEMAKDPGLIQKMGEAINGS
jgi:hypothetical protein